MVYFKYLINRAIDIIMAYGILFILFILQSIIIIYAFVKFKKIAWAQSFCILFILGQFIAVTIAAMDCIDRLLIPAYPFIIQIAASFLAILISFLKKEKIVESVL